MQKIPVNKIHPNPQQPRTFFDETALQELAASIRENGLQYPILVEDNGDGNYTLVSGERRLRAHRLLNLPDIQAIVRAQTNHLGRQRLVDAMIENVQRESMNPVEEAHGYRRMRDEFGMTATEIGRQMGISVNSILSRLKITELEPEIQELIASRQLPGSQQSVEAFLRVPRSDARVKLAKVLANRSATIRMVQTACNRLAATLEAPKPAGRRSEMPGLAIGAARANVELEEVEPEWDALYQVNRVPPWPMYVDSVQATCRACSLFPVASDATCRDCPLVESVRRILESLYERQ